MLFAHNPIYLSTCLALDGIDLIRKVAEDTPTENRNLKVLRIGVSILLIGIGIASVGRSLDRWTFLKLERLAIAEAVIRIMTSHLEIDLNENRSLISILNPFEAGYLSSIFQLFGSLCTWGHQKALGLLELTDVQLQQLNIELGLDNSLHMVPVFINNQIIFIPQRRVPMTQESLERQASVNLVASNVFAIFRLIARAQVSSLAFFHVFAR